MKRVNERIRDVSPSSGKRYRGLRLANLKVWRSLSIKALINDPLNHRNTIPLQDLTIKGENRSH